MRSYLRILFLIASLTLATCQLGASLREPCGPDTNCDPRALLTCISNSCECIKPKEMSFDQTKQKCLVVSGAKCAYSGDEKLDCVNGAICNSVGVCQCTAKHFKTVDKLCLPKRPNGETCTDDNQCQEDKLLSCVEGKCDCDTSEAVFDQNKNKCAGRARTSCSYEAYDRRGSYDTCMTGTSCQSHGRYTYRCECNGEYSPTKNRLCGLRYNQQCNGDIPCAGPLLCSYKPGDSDRRCRCPFPNHQFYNSTANDCVSFVDGPCLEEMNGEALSSPCVPNAACVNSSGIHRCTCETGWIESTGWTYWTEETSRMCALTHGQPCTSFRVPRQSSVWTHRCDRIAGLVCRNGVCSCKKLEIYDPKSTKCRGMVGASCDGSPGNESYCIDQAHCAVFRSESGKKGLCRCNYPYEPTSNRAKCSFHQSSPLLNIIQS